MTDKNGFLVVGGDSLVGSRLFRTLERRGHRALASTRRRDTLDAQRVYLDFESETPFRVPPGIQYAFLIAAATNYDRCEKDPLAHRINVELLPRLVASLLEQGLFVTFISTNSVFGGERPWPHEEDPHAPGIAYARQKSEGEKVIRAAAQRLNALDRLSIVRLTKILSVNTPPLPDWFTAFERGQEIRAFSDLVFAPLSLAYAADSLATLGELRRLGNFHLSGAKNVSYVEFAQEIARALGAPAELIVATTAVEAGVQIPFKPCYSGIGMRRTSSLTGLQPEPIEDVVRYLVRERRARDQQGAQAWA